MRNAQEAYERDQSGPLSVGGVYSFAYQPLPLLSSKAELASLRELLDSYTHAKPHLQSQHKFISDTLLASPSATAFLLMRQRNSDAKTLAAARASSVPGNFITLLAMLSHPYSRGSVHIASSSPEVHPRIDPSYLSSPLDIEVFIRHLLVIDRFLATEPMASCLKPGGKRLPASFPLLTEQMAKEDIDRMIRRCVATNYHPCGTCTMADDIALGGVVDSNLHVHGTRNVRVCDASVLPLIPRGNILSTVYAVAERGADIVKASI